MHRSVVTILIFVIIFFSPTIYTTGYSKSITPVVSLLLFGNSPDTARNKLVFISDIHMNVDANYSWMVDHADELAQFLKDLNNRNDVAELIILGDMVDDWVSPVLDVPQTFTDILTASNNSEIVPALQAVCSNPDIKVTFVVGNHDMLSFETLNTATLTNTFPGMIITADSPGLGAYSKDDVIWAEHGHRYCLFNAPDTWSRAGGHLPMGYFISRLAASKAKSTGQVTTTPELLDEHVMNQAGVNNGFWDDAAIIAIYNIISVWSGINPVTEKFFMNGKDSYTPDPFVEEIAFKYNSIYSNWSTRQDIVSNTEAIWNDVGFLNSAANLLFEMPDHLKSKYPFTPRIVLFGHTHQASFQYHAGEVDTVYVNTGTWIDSKPMSWAEIEIESNQDGSKAYKVALWFYGDTSPRQTASIMTAAP